MGEKVVKLEARVSSLFDAIKHGDDEHEKWLRKAIVDHFAGREVERPKGSGNREIIKQLQARIAGLEGETEHAARHLITKTEEGERWTALWKDRAEAAESALAQAKARIAELLKERDTQIGIGVTDAEEMDQLAQRAEAAESANAQAEAREADSRHCFKRIIQVRAGDGMLQGKEALDEMARLAGEALSRLDQPENG